MTTSNDSLPPRPGTTASDAERMASQFREILIREIRFRSSRLSDLDFLGIAQRSRVSSGIARRVAEEIYTDHYRRAVARMALEGERKPQTDALARAMRIDPTRLA